VGKGSGLGLSQVFGLAKQSGGGVRIDSEPEIGTSVKVFLPRTAGRPLRDEVDDVDAADATPKNCKVLLVDDDNAVREVTAGILADLGYTVVQAASGGAALDLLDRQSEIDLLLLDFAMPGMNGAEVAHEAHVRRPDLPILFVTGYADTEILESAPSDGIVRKPFVERELAAKLRLALHVD
jgi:CheY-like chemotaxis protein